jgi:hypothetical protein
MNRGLLLKESGDCMYLIPRYDIHKHIYIDRMNE